MRASSLALAALLALLRPSSAEGTVITILTGSPSGVDYPLGGAPFQHLRQGHSGCARNGTGDCRLGREFKPA